MIPRLVSAFVVTLAILLPARLAAADPVDDLRAQLQVAQVIEIMRAEGLAYGASLEQELFPGQGGPGWTEAVSALYDTGRISADFDARFRAELPADRIPAMMAFFGSPLGHRIVELEVTARRALLATDVQEAAKARLHQMEADKAPRIALLQDFAQANDLIESNVAGTMNSDIAFYRGMVEGRAKGFDLTEAQILSEVGSQEDGIRKDTRDWLMPYLVLAYQPLSDADLRAYTAFSRSPAGQALNAALFDAFNAAFNRVSHDLGRSAARFLTGQAL